MLHQVIDYNPSLLLPDCLTRVALAVLNAGERECLLVGSSNDRGGIIGLLTQAKLLQHIATVQDWENYSVEAIAIRDFIICPESELDNPIKLGKLIENSHLTHLLITNEENKIIGVLLAKHIQQILNINQEVEAAFINRLDAEIERQQLLQQKLHTSYTQTNALLGAMSDIVLVIDLETDNLKIELPNPNLTNDTIADFLNQTLEQFYDSDYSEWFVGQVKLALKEQNTIEFEYTLLDNSNTAWFVASISPLSEHSVIWVARNISDRKQAEAELAKLSLVASKTDNLVVISDRHGAIEWVNESFIKTTRYTLAEVRGRQLGGFLQGALTTRETVEKMRQAIQDRVPFQGEILNYSKDGKPYWLTLSINPIFADRGELTNFIAIESDITQRKQSEQEVLKALNKEKELSQLKSDFITIASHEFRTPLTVIMAAAKLLKHYDDRLSQEQKQQQLDRLLRGCDRILRLLEDILILGKADAGKIEFNPAFIDLELFCEELLGELRLSDDDRHDFMFTYQGKPHQKVPIDEHLLHHILSNLLANALKYSPLHREIELDLQICDRQAIFKIRDRGIGIPPEDMQHLFEAFHRAKNANNIQGTGLGLMIVKRAVDLHSGTISVESKVGEGTTFTAIVPF